MKTYNLDVIHRIKRFSKEFNASKALCDKTWIVFNDSGKREVYIFQLGGTLYITIDGVGVIGKWKWVAANNSLIINRDGKVMVLHPEFIDNSILALNLDGTNEMAFLINQKNEQFAAAKKTSQLEQLLIEKENILMAEELKDELQSSWSAFLIYLVFILLMSPFLIIYIDRPYQRFLGGMIEDSPHGSVLSFLIILFFYFIYLSLPLIPYKILMRPLESFFYKRKLKKWIKEHPDDPRIEYLN